MGLGVEYFFPEQFQREDGHAGHGFFFSTLQALENSSIFVWFPLYKIANFMP